MKTINEVIESVMHEIVCDASCGDEGTCSCGIKNPEEVKQAIINALKSYEEATELPVVYEEDGTLVHNDEIEFYNADRHRLADKFWGKVN